MDTPTDPTDKELDKIAHELGEREAAISALSAHPTAADTIFDIVMEAPVKPEVVAMALIEIQRSVGDFLLVMEREATSQEVEALVKQLLPEYI